MVTTPTGGQVIIPTERQHVLTVDPYPPVLRARHITPKSASPSGADAGKNNKINREPADSLDEQTVWRRLCAGKKLSKRERMFLEDHPLPYDWRTPCKPAWNGEK